MSIVGIIIAIILILGFLVLFFDKKKVEKTLGKKLRFTEYLEFNDKKQKELKEKNKNDILKDTSKEKMENITSSVNFDYFFDSQKYYRLRPQVQKIYEDNIDMLLNNLNCCKTYTELRHFLNSIDKILYFYNLNIFSKKLKNHSKDVKKMITEIGLRRSLNPNYIKDSKNPNDSFSDFFKNSQEIIELHYIISGARFDKTSEIIYMLNELQSTTENVLEYCLKLSQFKITSDEIEGLINIILNNKDFISFFPMDIVYEKISKTSPQDYEQLRDFFNALTGFCGLNSPRGSIRILNEDPDSIEFEDKNFVLTGSFTCANREDIENMIKNKGGHITGEVSYDTDYLIQGLMADKRYTYVSFGRKFEKAVEINKRTNKNEKIVIISEDYLLKFL